MLNKETSIYFPHLRCWSLGEITRRWVKSIDPRCRFLKGPADVEGIQTAHRKSASSAAQQKMKYAMVSRQWISNFMEVLGGKGKSFSHSRSPEICQEIQSAVFSWDFTTKSVQIWFVVLCLSNGGSLPFLRILPDKVTGGKFDNPCIESYQLRIVLSLVWPNQNRFSWENRISPNQNLCWSGAMRSHDLRQPEQGGK